MKKEKALELVERYSRLTRAIADCGRRIGESLDSCHGISGKRLDTWRSVEVDAKNRDTDLHLTQWYKPDTVDDWTMIPMIVYGQISSEHEAECPNCYKAHLAIQERKQLRKQLACVKGAMTKAVK